MISNILKQALIFTLVTFAANLDQNFLVSFLCYFSASMALDFYYVERD